MDLKTILQSWEVDLFIQERHFKCIFLNAKNSQNQNDRTVGVGRDLCGLPPFAHFSSPSHWRGRVSGFVAGCRVKPSQACTKPRCFFIHNCFQEDQIQTIALSNVYKGDRIKAMGGVS